MANGQMGKRISEETKVSALKLIAKGNTVPQVAVRLGVSQSVIRNWVRGNAGTVSNCTTSGSAEAEKRGMD
jgi:transposase-like protein